MKSYRQYCGVAKALDVLGDRWTLLIVRELLALGPCRYTDLLRGLPGISTNLLAERLRQMEEHGILARRAPMPPVASPLYRLTERGEALWPVLRELGTWAGPLLAETSERDEFRTHWLALPIRAHLTDNDPDAAPARLTIDTGDEPITVTAADGTIAHTLDDADPGAATLAGDPAAVVGFLLGRAEPGSIAFDGDETLLDRILKTR